MPAPTVPAPAGDDTTRKKVIEPIPSDGKSSSDDLHALLAKEGITDMDTPEQNSATSAALPGTQPMQHAPGHVISPNATDANGQPVDPNSIAL
ncbi:MAG TPA: hypothetical protein VLF91_04335 [Candidatus Saccharimonadales bacterium]|nr:hypothetical protein [Candidatus Saccharimonadales bacterium]